MIGENIKTSTKESLSYYEMKKHNHVSMKDVQNYWIKGNKLNWSGYRIQMT
jgi:hypothetical protein